MVEDIKEDEEEDVTMTVVMERREGKVVEKREGEVVETMVLGQERDVVEEERECAQVYTSVIMHISTHIYWLNINVSKAEQRLIAIHETV